MLGAEKPDVSVPSQARMLPGSDPWGTASTSLLCYFKQPEIQIGCCPDSRVTRRGFWGIGYRCSLVSVQVEHNPFSPYYP